MAKSSKQEIERDEKKVLYELMKDSSQSLNVISNKLGFSRQKTWRVIKKLQKDKTIWGYTAIVDSEKIGKKTYVLLGKRTAKPASQDMIDIVIKGRFDKLGKKNNCILKDTYYLNGEYDFITIFKAGNIFEAKRFQEEFNLIYQGYIEKTKLLEVLFPVRENGLFNPDVENFSGFF